MTCRAQIILLSGLFALGCSVGPAGEGAGADGASADVEGARGGEALRALRADARAPLDEAEGGEAAFGGPLGGFDARYVDCDEFAGVGLVPLENVAGRVPEGYAVVEPLPGSALVVAQGGRCEAISVEGRHRRRGIFAQFGVGVLPPTGEGDGNFYQLMFATNHPALAARLLLLGANARFAPGLDYDIEPTGGLDVFVPQPFLLAWRHEGPITPPDPGAPPNPVTTFNYWYESPLFGNVLQKNVVHGIRFGEGSSVVMRALGPEMRQIVGAEAMTFALFSKPEVFDFADLSVRANAF